MSSHKSHKKKLPVPEDKTPMRNPVMPNESGIGCGLNTPYGQAQMPNAYIPKDCLLVTIARELDQDVNRIRNTQIDIRHLENRLSILKAELSSARINHQKRLRQFDEEAREATMIAE